MKKIFKYGCGCLGIIFGLIILLIIFALCDSPSDSQKQKSVNQNNDSIEVFDGIDPKIDPQLKWNKKGARKFLQESATTHVENYLEQNELCQGFDPKTKHLYIVVTEMFSEREYRRINFSRNQIELKAFMLYLQAISLFFHTDMKLIENEKPKEMQKGISSTSSIKWGDFDFFFTRTATETANAGIAEYFEEKSVLSRNGNDHITYIIDSKGCRFNVSNIRIRGIAAYDELIRNFLKYHPGAVKLEYSAWSWDEKNKCGEFALLMVLDFNKIPKVK